jgi:hypothetical protein
MRVLLRYPQGVAGSVHQTFQTKPAHGDDLFLGCNTFTRSVKNRELVTVGKVKDRVELMLRSNRQAARPDATERESGQKLIPKRVSHGSEGREDF